MIPRLPASGIPTRLSCFFSTKLANRLIDSRVAPRGIRFTEHIVVAVFVRLAQLVFDRIDDFRERVYVHIERLHRAQELILRREESPNIPEMMGLGCDQQRG